jgi:hypothetical protein
MGVELVAISFHSINSFLMNLRYTSGLINYLFIAYLFSTIALQDSIGLRKSLK